MMNLVIFLIILSGILFLGIFIMMKPSIFISSLTSNEKAPVDQSLALPLVPKEIIVLGSTLIIVGLVGLSILGFRIFKESKGEETME
jgi:hypothetical protein